MTDLDNAYALSLNLAFSVGDEMKRLLERFGLDLSSYQGNDAWMLPIPATFVVGTDGRVTARFVDPDYRRRCRSRIFSRHCEVLSSTCRRDLVGDLESGKTAATPKNRQPEAAGPGASWIEVKQSIMCLYHSSVGVADHNNCGAVGYRVERGLRPVVDHVENAACYADILRQRKVQGPSVSVDVSPHGNDRRYVAKSFENSRRPDITCVQDKI